MNDSSHEPRPFDCPDCGHHHKADLHGMVGHPEIHGKVPCAGCGKTLWLSLDEKGEALVELYEEHLHEAVHQQRIAAHKAKTQAEAAAEGTATAGGSGGGGSLVVSVIAAAVVAVVVSLVMGGSKSGGDGEGHNDAKIQALEQSLDDLKGVAATAGADVSEVGRKLGELETRLNERIATLSEATKGDPAALKAIQDTGAALTEALRAVKASYKAVHGRIEGNYTRLNQVEKRLKKLEAP